MTLHEQLSELLQSELNVPDMLIHHSRIVDMVIDLCAPKWISVEERLPDNENWVRVAYDNKIQILPCFYCTTDEHENPLLKEEHEWCEYGNPKTPLNVTHWMPIENEPLPNPPQP